MTVIILGAATVIILTVLLLSTMLGIEKGIISVTGCWMRMRDGARHCADPKVAMRAMRDKMGVVFTHVHDKPDSLPNPMKHV